MAGQWQVPSGRWHAGNVDENGDDEEVGDVSYGSSDENIVQSPYFMSGFQSNGCGQTTGLPTTVQAKSRTIDQMKRGRKPGSSHAPLQPLSTPVHDDHSHRNPQAIEQLDGGGLEDTGNAAATVATPQSQAQPQRNMLRTLEYLEGEIKTLPNVLIRRLQRFCMDNNTRDLPCAKGGGSNENGLRLTRNGYQRKWMALPTEEELQLGRFKYGSKLRFTAAQAPTGSDWERGDVVIIVFSGATGLWKIWRFQKTLSEIPDSDCLVACQQVFRPPRTSNNAVDDRPSAHASRRHVSVQVTSAYKKSRSASADADEDDESVASSHVAIKPLLFAKKRGLLPISYKEGEIQTFPATLIQSLQDFVDVNPNAKLSCAQSDWGPKTSLQKTGNGNARQWVTHPYGEPLRMSRFQYGKDQKILVAQAYPGSNWQKGEPKIVVYGGRGNHVFKIWGGQRVLDTISDEFALVQWVRSEDAVESVKRHEDAHITQDALHSSRSLRGSLGKPSAGIQPSGSSIVTRPPGTSSAHSAPADVLLVGSPSASLLSTKAKKLHATSPTKSSKRALDGEKDRLRGTKKAKIVTNRDLDETPPVDAYYVNDLRHPESSIAPSSDIGNSVKRIGRAGGLLQHLRRLGTAGGDATPAGEKSPAPSTPAIGSAEQKLRPLPIRQSPKPQPSKTQLLGVGMHSRTLGADDATHFDISTTTIFFVDKADQIVFECTFSETPDIRRLFARARVARIATQATLLLEAQVGETSFLLQKDAQRDFEAMESAINDQEVIEVTVREELV